MEGYYDSSTFFHKQVYRNIIITIYYNCHYRDSVRFAFGCLLQQQLNSFVLEWNMHRIRPSNMAEAPCGIPNIIFDFPELKGTVHVHVH